MLRRINERPAPNSLALRGDASARGGISLGLRAAAPVLHVHSGQVPGFFGLRASGFPELRNGEDTGRADSSAIETGSIDRYQSRGDFHMPISGAIPGFPQQRSQERRGLRARVFHVCDGAHAILPGLAFAPWWSILQSCYVIAPALVRR